MSLLRKNNQPGKYAYNLGIPAFSDIIFSHRNLSYDLTRRSSFRIPLQAKIENSRLNTGIVILNPGIIVKFEGIVIRLYAYQETAIISPAAITITDIARRS